MSVATVRTILRSAAARTASTAARAPINRCSSKQIPLTNRFFRKPVELSFCVETMLPYHTATASALLNWMISASRGGYGLTLEDFIDDV